MSPHDKALEAAIIDIVGSYPNARFCAPTCKSRYHRQGFTPFNQESKDDE